MPSDQNDKAVQVEIMMADLTPEKQAEILDALHMKSAEDGNYDVVPLFILELYPYDGEEGE